MQLKLFGPSSVPDEQFVEDLNTLFGIDQDGWDLVAEWFLTTDRFDPEGALSSPAVVASALLPEQFIASVNAVRYLLEAWHIYSLQLSEIQHDLIVLGHPAVQVGRLGALLSQLERVKQPVHSALMRSDQENAILPTLEDIDVVCDVRPIFGDYVYPIPEPGDNSHTKLLGFSYMTLMGLSLEDFEGNRHTLSFQMTEDTLADFKAALQRATDQLDILKTATRGISNKHT